MNEGKILNKNIDLKSIIEANIEILDIRNTFSQTIKEELKKLNCRK